MGVNGFYKIKWNDNFFLKVFAKWKFLNIQLYLAIFRISIVNVEIMYSSDGSVRFSYDSVSLNLDEKYTNQCYNKLIFEQN